MINNNLFHKSHLHFGWGSDKFNIDNPEGKYWINYERSTYIPTNFKDEFKKAMIEIVNNFNKPIVVHSSGGIDSEATCLTLIELEIPFIISIMHIKSKDNINCNEHENRYVHNFVNKHKIKHTVNTIDIEEYIQSKFLEEAHKYKTYRLGMMLQAELIQFFPDHLNLFGDGRFSLSRYREFNIDKDGLVLVDDIGLMHTYFKSIELEIDAIRRVFMWTPALMLSYLLDKDVAHWIKNAEAFWSNMPKFGWINCEQIKRFMTYRHWPQLEPRPKYTGLENVSFLKNKDFKDPCMKIWVDINNLYNTKETLVYRSVSYQNLINLLYPEELKLC